MSEDECFVDGARYVAVQVSEACEKCALAKIRGCCRRLKCIPSERSDGRSVFWQLATSATDELTALREMNRELVEALEDLRDHMNSLDPSSMESVEAAEASMKRAGALIAKARGEA